MKEIYGNKPTGEIIAEIVSTFKKADAAEYFGIYNRYLPFLWGDRSLYTVRNLYQDVLKEVGAQKIAKGKRDAIVAVFTLTTEFFTALNIASQQKEIERMNDKTEFSIEAYLTIMQTIKDGIKAKKYKGKGAGSDAQAMANAMMVYVAMATGRRFFEIIKTVDLIKEKKELFFSGLAKKGDNEELFPAVLLDDDVQFIKKCLIHIRETFNTENMDSKQINSKFSGIVNKAVVKLVGEGVSMHTLRERYAEICVQTKRPEQIDENLFRDFVLSHETKLTAGDFYKAQKGV